ncbi:MAG: hypothetical protein SH848_00355 [Saprospiraceae bacterium]|nr:hypothetical protein [Saprospiraceae bacterium]MDZ4702347.1 hypothetical protein [Saprospiraceae bacterium]
MRIQEQFQLLARLDQLICLKATGTPAMLAQRFTEETIQSNSIENIQVKKKTIENIATF